MSDNIASCKIKDNVAEDMDFEHENEWPILDPKIESILTETHPVERGDVNREASRKRKRSNTATMTPVRKRTEKRVECALCQLTSNSDEMVGCNSCTVKFHLSCIGVEGRSTIKGNEVFCARCALENQQEESEDSQEMNAMKNIQRRRKSQKVEIGKSVVRIKKSPQTQKCDEINVVEKLTFYGCNQCTKLFIKKVNLEIHHKIHDEPTINKCPERIFLMNSSDLSCPLCHTRFRNEVDHIIHVASHAEENCLSPQTEAEILSRTVKP